LYKDREELWQSLSAGDKRPWDVIVVGGGITGAGVLREAARMGLKALLIEQRDFAWGTSSRSSKMVHGGLRYLAQGDLKLTRHSLQERERLLKEAPGLVDRMGYYMMLRRGQFPGRLAMTVILTIYDFIAGVKDNRYCDRDTVNGLFPGINNKNLRGASYYTDAVTDDARLVLRVLQEALKEEGESRICALNYVKAQKLLQRDGRVSGLLVEDVETGRMLELKASVVINATGTWADRLRNEVNPEQRVRPLRGSHLVISRHRLPMVAAANFINAEDKRPVFIFPWEGATVVGTTDLDHSDDLDIEASITTEELDYLLQLVDDQFPDSDITRDDIIATYAGVRPVIASEKSKKTSGLNSVKPSKERRDHAVWCDAGLITVSGGKLTTFRLIARDAIEAAQPWLLGAGRQSSDNSIFSATQINPVELFADDLTRSVRLLGRYGDCSARMIDQAASAEKSKIEDTEYCLAECRWAVKNESVLHLDDLMLRRTHLGLLLKNGGAQLFSVLRAIFAEEKGWDSERWEQEQERYMNIWRQHYFLPQSC
jgi:glycerol-3-phosphate dehydrogenase